MNKYLFNFYYFLERLVRSGWWRLRYGLVLRSRFQTLQQVISQRKSLIRLGDGECLMMFDDSGVYFQEKDPVLREKLLKIVTTAPEQIELTFNNEFVLHTHWPVVRRYERSSKNYARYLSIKSAEDVGLLSRRNEQSRYVGFLTALTKISPRRVWGDATVFFLGNYYHMYKRDELTQIYSLYKQLFSGKNVLIICPEDPIMSPSFKQLLDDKVIASPKTVEIISIPSHNAFSNYEGILQSAKAYKNKADIVLIQAGPLAKVLVYDLTVQDGMWAVDVGSLNVSLHKAYVENGFIF